MLNIARLTIILLFVNISAWSQFDSSIIVAEKNFAFTARQESFRVAFLNNLDSNGLIFENGNVYNAIEAFSKMKETAAKLLWHPSFACASKSGDLGFTTGAFEFRKEMNSKVLSAGQYSSVWIKRDSGGWKLLLDLGIDFDSSIYQNSLPTHLFSDLVLPESKMEWTHIEKSFIDKFEKQGVAAFITVLHESSWFNLQNKLPLSSKKAIVEVLEEVPENILFKPAGSGCSNAGDLFYVYGDVISGTRKENYLRIWGHTLEGWKIILQVLKW